MSREHGTLIHLERLKCIPNAKLRGTRPIYSSSNLDDPDLIQVDCEFQSEGIFDVNSGKRTTIRFFVTYRVKRSLSHFDYPIVSFFADDDCLRDEEGNLVPRMPWPFTEGRMTLFLRKLPPSADQPSYEIVLYAKNE